MSLVRFTEQVLKDAPPAPFAVDWVVRMQDIDAAGIVFFARLFEAFTDALTDWLDHNGMPLTEAGSAGETILPLRHASAEFLAPLVLGDRVKVEIVGARVEETEVLFGFRIRRPSDGRILAVGETLHVAVERAAFRRSPVPGRLSQAARALPSLTPPEAE